MEPLIGQIQLFPYTYSPMYWAYCNGASIQINQNQALYSLLGFTFGGDGRTYFMLPDLRNSNPLQLTNQIKYCIATAGYYPDRP